MQISKLGVENVINSKEIATPAVVLEGPSNEPIAFSRRAMGMQWKVSHGDDMSALFGAGGHQDGVTALINTTRDHQLEDDCAVSTGYQEHAIDVNIHPIQLANMNSEFNFSNLKHGSFTYRDPEPRFAVSGLTSQGDLTLRVDPYAATALATSQALGACLGGTYKLDGRSEIDEGTIGYGLNPFTNTEAETQPAPGLPMAEGLNLPQEEDFTYFMPDAMTDADERDINRNMETGMRRSNIRKRDSRLLERVATQADIMGALESVSTSYAENMRIHFKQAYKTPEDREEELARLRPDSSKYMANQIGVGDVSRATAKAYRKKKLNGPTKLNSILVGV